MKALPFFPNYCRLYNQFLGCQQCLQDISMLYLDFRFAKYSALQHSAWRSQKLYNSKTRFPFPVTSRWPIPFNVYKVTTLNFSGDLVMEWSVSDFLPAD